MSQLGPCWDCRDCGKVSCCSSTGRTCDRTNQRCDYIKSYRRRASTCEQSHLPTFSNVVLRLFAFRLNGEALRLLAPLPKLPHVQIGGLDVASEAVGVKQGMGEPVFRQLIAIPLEQ
jgi:hypothetical protein